MPDLLSELTAGSWVLLAVAAFFVGMSKTALPGVNTLAVAIFAAILPARASTAALLILLLLGDVFAIAFYRRHADWATLIKLVPTIAAGMIIGAFFLAYSNDTGVQRAIGIILLLLMAVTIWQRRWPSQGSDSLGRLRVARVGYGTLGGFTTMVANAGSAAMSMYLLAARFQVQAFLGTAAWLFALINLSKVPVVVGLGLVSPTTLLLDLMLAPGVVVGALVGWLVARRIKQVIFDWAVIVATIAGAIYLLV